MWCANCNKTSYSDVCEVCGGKTQQDTPIELYWDNIRIDEINTNISSYEKSIEEINEILRQAAPSKGLQRRRDTIARDLRDEEEELVANNKKILSLFSRSSLPLLITPFLTKVS